MVWRAKPDKSPPSVVNICRGGSDMNKAELIRSLKALQDELYITDNCRVRELDTKEIKQKKIGVGDVIVNLLIDSLFGAFTFAVSYAALVVVKFLANWVFNTSFKCISKSTLYIAIVIGIVTIAILLWVSLESLSNQYKNSYKSDIALKEKQKKLLENVDQIDAEYMAAKREHAKHKKNVERMRANIGLHPDYDVFSLKWIIDLLEHGRADNLKEAINLYLQESHQAQMELDESRERIHRRQVEEQKLKELENIRHENERAADAAEGARESAEEAAFWSALSADRIKKYGKKR